jgi:hypothetical protein
MLAQLGAILTAVRSVVERLFGDRFRLLAGMAVAALTLGGSLPTAVPLAGADPADPSAKVAGIRYRSTVAPYDGNACEAFLRIHQITICATPITDVRRTWTERLLRRAQRAGEVASYASAGSPGA